MTPKMQEIWDKLRQLATYDSKLTVFGAGSHRYRTYPCLTEVEIEEFERQYQVLLPEDYRSFILEIANGGAGPNYGLCRLQDSVEENSLFLLSRSFPHQESWNLHHSQFASAQDFDEEYFRGEHRQGSLSICDMGCGHTVLLVVSGAERGTIWQDFRAGDGGIIPLQDVANGSVRTSFTGWYAGWLNNSLAT